MSINLDKLLEELADEVIEVAQKNLGAYRSVKGANGKTYKRRAVASGNLKNNLGYSIKKIGNTSNIVFSAGGKAKNYYLAVNNGRNGTDRKFNDSGKTPSMPPSSDIESWMRIKPIRLRGAKGFIKQTPKGMARAAFAIAKSIKKRGIDPFPYYTDAINEVLEKRIPQWTEEITKQLDLKIAEWQ